MYSSADVIMFWWMPQVWISGVWTVDVMFGGSATDVTIGTANMSNPSINGTSNAFDVLSAVGWLDGWNNRKSHIIENATGAGTGYQVPILVDYGSGVDGGDTVYLNEHCQPDFDDIRFTDNDGVTELDYWIQEKTDSDYAMFWVEVADNLNSSDATIYLYYGNTAVSTTSNGTETFPDGFDDFEGDLSFWDYMDDSGGSVALSTDTSCEGDYSVKYDLTISGDDIALRHFLTWDTNFAIGFSVKIMQTTGRVAACPVAWLYPENEVVHVVAWEDGYFKYKDPSEFEMTSIMAYSADQWYHIEARVTQGSADFDLVIDGAEVVSSGGYEIASSAIIERRGVNSDGITLGMNNAEGVCYFDGVYIRKYVAPEPAHGIWGAEENLLG
jgi:hypothetical protein